MRKYKENLKLVKLQVFEPTKVVKDSEKDDYCWTIIGPVSVGTVWFKNSYDDCLNYCKFLNSVYESNDGLRLKDVEKYIVDGITIIGDQKSGYGVFTPSTRHFTIKSLDELVPSRFDEEVENQKKAEDLQSRIMDAWVPSKNSYLEEDNLDNYTNDID